MEECFNCGGTKQLKEITTAQTENVFFIAKAEYYERFLLCKTCDESIKDLDVRKLNKKTETGKGNSAYKNPLASFIDWVLRKK